MQSYFKEGNRSRLVEAPGRQLPISPDKSDWIRTEDPEMLQRVYLFTRAKNLIYFLEDVIQFQEEMHHHGKILVDHMQVMVQISTKKIERITDLDVEWARKVDEIYEDVQQEDENEDIQQEG